MSTALVAAAGDVCMGLAKRAGCGLSCLQGHQLLVKGNGAIA